MKKKESGETMVKITESWENYLEAIYILRLESPFVRSIDVANYLGFSKASVSRAVGNLRDANLVIVNDAGGLEFTPEGESIAAAIYEKHVVLKRLLIELGVKPKIAAEDACRIEHVINEETFNKIKDFVTERFPEESHRAV